MEGKAKNTESVPEEKELPRRLCNEIQLFDLCDLNMCNFKDGKFCTDPDMLARFEAVSEPEERPAPCYDDDDEYDEAPYEDEIDDDDDSYSVFDDEDDSELKDCY